MDSGYLEGIPEVFVQHMTDLEMRILSDIVRRLEINGFSTASADWQISRLQQIGESEETIRRLIREEFFYEDEELDQIFSDKVYEEYMGHSRFYKLSGMELIPFEDNIPLQNLIEAVRRQTKDAMDNITRTMGIATKDIYGRTNAVSLIDYYRRNLDRAIMDIKSGAFDYQSVLKKVTQELANSGIRTIDYSSGRTDRIEVATRRAIMTGFRQVQGYMNEQTAAELGIDSYEVTWHAGARPSHQIWQGRVYTYKELQDICGLGTMLGLHGINCYHDYSPHIPGVSVRTYTDKELDRMNAAENEPKEYKGKEYTTYQALQKQRKFERQMRADREQIWLMKAGKADEKELTALKAHYKGLEKEYYHFSKKMALPEQWDRVMVDGLKREKRKK